MIDLSKPVTINDTFEVKVLDENGKDSGHAITVYGDDSKHCKALVHKARNTAFARKKDLTAEQITDQTMDMVAKCIESWDIKDGKKIAELTIENIKKLFTAAPWVYEQVIIAKGNRDNFLESAPKS